MGATAHKIGFLPTVECGALGISMPNAEDSLLKKHGAPPYREYRCTFFHWQIFTLQSSFDRENNQSAERRLMNADEL